jgi:5-methylcytosine-specific restriction endonuclease McrA
MQTAVWNSWEWKAMREETLHSTCQICGSTNKLVVHHARHRRTLYQIVEQVAWKHIGRPSLATYYGQAYLAEMCRHPSFEIKREAGEIYRREHEWYLSGKDTITLCGQCHYDIELGGLRK